MRNNFIEKLLCFALLVFIALVPMDSIGFKIGFFRVGVPMLILYGIALFSLPYCFKDKPTFILYLLFMFWAFMITFTRWPMDMVIKPLGALLLISLPIFVRPFSLKKQHIFLAISCSILLNLFLNLVNILIYFSGIGASLGAIIGEFYIGNGFILKMGMLRMQGGFSEPAHHAVYCLALLLLMAKFGYLKEGSRWVRFSLFNVTLLLFITSFSMAGYILIAVIVVAQVFLLNVRIKYKVLTISASLVFLLAAYFIPALYQTSFGRIETILDSFHGVSLEYGNWDSSRTAPFIVLKEYLDEKGAVGFFIGEGYGNFEYWLFDRYYGLTTSFARGAMPNLIVALFLGSGVVGVVLFFSFLYSYFRNLHWREKLFLACFLIVLFNAYAIIVNELFWFIFLMLRLMYDREKRTLYSSNPRTSISNGYS